MPGVADEVAAMFKVEPPEPGDAMVAGEKLAVTPVGIPNTVRVTAEVIPVVVVLMAAVLVAPCDTVAA